MPKNSKLHGSRVRRITGFTRRKNCKIFRFQISKYSRPRHTTNKFGQRDLWRFLREEILQLIFFLKILSFQGKRNRPERRPYTRRFEKKQATPQGKLTVKSFHTRVHSSHSRVPTRLRKHQDSHFPSVLEIQGCRVPRLRGRKVQVSKVARFKGSKNSKGSMAFTWAASASARRLRKRELLKGAFILPGRQIPKFEGSIVPHFNFQDTSVPVLGR